MLTSYELIKRVCTQIVSESTACYYPRSISFSNGRTQTFQMSYLPIIELTVNLINRDFIQLTFY